MAARFAELVVDSREPERLAEFWVQALGWAPTGRYPAPACEIADPTSSRPSITFVPNGERKAAKNRLHIDLVPEGTSQQHEVERLISLGATRVDIGQGERSWVVLADPEGNEFCVLAAYSD
ncbi:MAG: VOC family protein [Chloroflexota bacterium]